MCELDDYESSKCRVDESKCGISYQEMELTIQGQDQMLTDFFDNIKYINCVSASELYPGMTNTDQKVNHDTSSTKSENHDTGSGESEDLPYILIGSFGGLFIVILIAVVGVCVCRQKKHESPEEKVFE